MGTTARHALECKEVNTRLNNHDLWGKQPLSAGLLRMLQKKWGGLEDRDSLRIYCSKTDEGINRKNNNLNLLCVSTCATLPLNMSSKRSFYTAIPLPLAWHSVCLIKTGFHFTDKKFAWFIWGGLPFHLHFLEFSVRVSFWIFHFQFADRSQSRCWDSNLFKRAQAHTNNDLLHSQVSFHEWNQLQNPHLGWQEKP